ncbi:MAG: hypothetical protein LBM02_06050 [Lachnospiraceae bacterium]|jgi:hypothetical protein|nr:hypothetical protein [Lachnospiraceae bacterium]
MKKNKKIILVILLTLILAIIILILKNYPGNTSKVKISYDTSAEQFSLREQRGAANAVLAYFNKEFTWCRLNNLKYNEEYTEEYNKNNSKDNKIKYIYFTGEFTPGYLADGVGNVVAHEKTEYSWIVEKKNNSWTLTNYGNGI